MKQLFDSATLKLTMWYLLGIMLISLVFSAIIFQVSNSELSRPLPIGARVQRFFSSQSELDDINKQRASEARSRLVFSLVLLNTSTLIIGGGASYLLARRTLSPIKQAMDEQARFVGDASHELRTPLAAMRSEIEVSLRKESQTPKRLREALASNLEEVVKLQGLSDRLLQLSGDKKLSISEVSLEDVAIEALSRIEPAASAKGVAIDNKVGPVKVRGNADGLIDLLVILLDNAVKYSEAGKKIGITAKSEGNRMTLSVLDHGEGIKPEDLPRIFERFYRVDNARSRQVDGHGLGLSIAQAIAEAHGTQIEVTSTLGKGSVFSISLPVV